MINFQQVFAGICHLPFRRQTANEAHLMFAEPAREGRSNSASDHRGLV